MAEKFDFSGWATKYGTLCTDGRTLKDGAFAHCDGKKVPIAWQHDHNTPSNILGNAILKHVDGEGVYAYGKFNDTESGKDAKILVKHGDIDSLSIFANHLREMGNNVYHGDIKEVSLVLAAANPEAHIENVLIHSDDGTDARVDYTQAEIWSGPSGFELDVDGPDLAHSDSETDETEDSNDMDYEKIYNSMTDEQKALVDLFLDEEYDSELEHADDDAEEDDVDLEGIYDEMSDAEKSAMNYLVEITKKTNGDPNKIAQVADGEKLQKASDIVEKMDEEKQFAVMYKIGSAVPQNAMAHSDLDYDIYEGGNDTMKENIFDRAKPERRGTTLSHSDTEALIELAKKNHVSSFRELLQDELAERRRYIQHDDDPEPTPAATYGIENIDYLFPDAQAMTERPEFIKRDTGWVNSVITGTKHVPFSRIKTIFADITEDEARAKGYIKGNQKKTEVFKLLKRVTEPCRIYKLQKLDKDDIDDIRWDIVPYMKAEMRTMIDEELARAAVYSDGREDGVDNDKIPEDKIRPIVSDADLYTIKVEIEGTDPTLIAAQLPDELCLAMDDYKGSGNVTAYVKQSLYTRMLLTKDGMGYRLYKSPSELASAMSVSKIVPVPNDVAGDNYVVALDLQDYAFGAEKGGQMSTFDDFDIDFNQYKYLMEVRTSGALVKPYSAIVLKRKETNSNVSG